MTTCLIRRAPRASAFVTLLLLLAVVPVAHATDSDEGGETGDGWKKVLAYARCAFEVFEAITPAQWGTAIFDCGRTFIDETPSGSKP